MIQISLPLQPTPCPQTYTVSHFSSPAEESMDYDSTCPSPKPNAPSHVNIFHHQISKITQMKGLLLITGLVVKQIKTTISHKKSSQEDNLWNKSNNDKYNLKFEL